MNYLKLLRAIRNEPDIETAFLVYISSLKGVKWSRFQIRMCINFIRSRGYTCLNWCRAAGKTEKCAHLAVFFLIYGKEVYWYASSTKQLVQAMKYWSNNPFIESFSPNRTRTQIHSINNDVMGCACLSESNASGPRAAVVFYDEVALMKMDMLVKSFGVANHVSDPRFLMFSTPQLESPFHDFVRKYGANKVIYTDCDWFNHKQIEEQKIPGLEWMWEQENLCKFTNPDGAVFPADRIIVRPITKDFIKRHLPKKFIFQGVDFGMSKGHNLCRIGIRDDGIYILKEMKIPYMIGDDMLQSLCEEYPTEIEDGGWNTTYAPNFRGVTKVPFTIETKANKIRLLLAKPIYIDKELCPNTLKELRQATWVQKGQHLTVETNELDYLSALMHAVREHTTIEYEMVGVNDAYNDIIAQNPWASRPF